jgi:hypothetical protein
VTREPREIGMVMESDGDGEIGFAEARARLGVHRSTLWRWVEEGRILAQRRPDGQLRLQLADVLRLRRTRASSGEMPPNETDGST